MLNFIKHSIAKLIGIYINSISYVFPNKAQQLTYSFFSKPKSGKLKANKLPKFLQFAEKEIHKFENHSIQTYVWKGNTKSVLLVHGWESNASRWEHFFEFLKQTNYTIIAIDAPAHGLSSSNEFNIPLYTEFINEMKKKYNFNYLIGHSMGGIACAYFQKKYKPKQLQKLILLGTPCDFDILLQNFWKTFGLNNKILKYFENYIFLKFQIKTAEFNCSNFLKNENLSGIIAHDMHDNIIQYSEAEKIAAVWPNSKLITTKNLGHSMHNHKLYQELTQFIIQK